MATKRKVEVEFNLKDGLSKNVEKINSNLGALKKAFIGLKVIEGLKSLFTSLTSIAKDLAIGLKNLGVAAVNAFVDLSMRSTQIKQITLDFGTLSKTIGSDAPTAMRKLKIATKGTLAEFDLMQISNKLMLQGLVSTDDEMASLVKVADRLGDQTLTTKDRIDTFGQLLKNQSIRLLDDFGISSGNVRDRIVELQEEFPNMSREVAFNTAVLEEANMKMELLGEKTRGAGVSIQRIQVFFQELKDKALVAITPILDKVAGLLELVRDAFVERMPEIRAALDGLKDSLSLLGEAFGVTSDSAEDIAVSIGLVLADAVVKIIGFIDEFVVGFTEAVPEIKEAFGQVQLALSLLGNEANLAGDDVNELGDDINGEGDSLGKKAGKAAGEGLANLITKLADLITWWDENKDSILNAIQTFADLAKTILEVVDAAKDLGALPGNVTDLLKYTGPGAVISTLKGEGPGIIGKIQGNQAGTKFAEGGHAVVGERGPEIVNLPRGSKVTTAGETQRQLGSTVNINVDVSGAVITDQAGFFDQLKQSVISAMDNQNRLAQFGIS